MNTQYRLHQGKLLCAWLCGLLFALPGLLMAQNEIGRELQFYIANGFSISGDGNQDIEFFRRMDPGSAIFQRDYADYEESFDAWNANSAFSFGITFKPFTKADGSRSATRLRLGITYASVSTSQLSYSREDRSPADTLIQSSTGQSIFVDSVFYRSLSAGVESNMLYIDLGLAWESEWESRWTGSLGVGLSLGMSTSNWVYGSQTSFVKLDGDGFQSSGGIDLDRESRSRLNLDPAFGAMLSAQVGIDWRIAREHPFWSRTSLFLEGRPTLHMLHVQEADTRVFPAWFSFLGLRIRTW